MLNTATTNAILDYLSASFGEQYRRARLRPSGAGCINATFEVYGDQLESLFLKIGAADHLPMYQQEIQGLDLLRQCDAIRVPQAYGAASLEQSSVALLVMEFIELSPVRGAAEARFGAALARLHSVRGQSFGLEHDNYIGRSHQINGWMSDWWAFYAEKRLLPQRKLAQLKGMRRGLLIHLDQLLTRFPECLQGYSPKPALLHGDLWSGNMAVDASGMPTLFDPAVYYGDAETDLAMTRMFGAPGQAFYDAYHSVLPLEAGHELRRLLYDLYHWLNHFNLFGVGYLGQVETTLDTLLRELA